MDSALKVAVSRYGTNQWNKVAVLLDMSPQYCKAYWKKVMERKILTDAIQETSLQTAPARGLDSQPSKPDRKSPGKNTKQKQVSEGTTTIVDSVIAGFLRILDHRDPSIIAWILMIDELKLVVRQCNKIIGGEIHSLHLTRSELEDKVVGFFMKTLTSYFDEQGMSLGSTFPYIEERFRYKLRENVL